MPPVTKLTKSFLSREKNPKIKSSNSTENNTIDINISVNYHKNPHFLRSQDQLNNSIYKAPMKKVSSYSMNQSAHKRNGSDISDSNLFPNNLNISLTNISSPKTNNSFIVNPILFQNKTLDEGKRKKSEKRKVNNNHSNSTKNIIVGSLNMNEYSSHNDKKSSKSLISPIEDIPLKSPSVATSIRIVMEDKIKELTNKEQDLLKLNTKKYEIVQSSLFQYANLLHGGDKEFLLNILSNFKDILNFKNEQINALEKSKIKIII